jgi:uncharacterized protein DUF3179
VPDASVTGRPSLRFRLGYRYSSVRSRVVGAVAAFVFAGTACSVGGPPVVSGFDRRDLLDVLAADRIPAIVRPRFVPVRSVTTVADAEPVVALELAGRARAYPLQILLWHEIVNDRLGGRSVLLTYAPLCDAAVAFDRTVRGKSRVFANSGKLYRSDLVVYDRGTESLWPQLSERATLGDLSGIGLTHLSAQVMPFGVFRRAFADGEVLSRETGHSRSYGFSPYAGYESAGPTRSLLRHPLDRRLPAMERVVGVAIGSVERAYPFRALRSRSAEGISAVMDRVGGRDLVVVWERGMASALDAPLLARGRDVGWAGAFVPEVDGRPASFSIRGRRMVDSVTGSSWDAAGRAVAGRAKGARLQQVPFTTALWFAWSAFHPATRVWEP